MSPLGFRNIYHVNETNVLTNFIFAIQQLPEKRTQPKVIFIFKMTFRDIHATRKMTPYERFTKTNKRSTSSSHRSNDPSVGLVGEKDPTNSAFCNASLVILTTSGSQVIKLFPCSTQLSMKFKLLINTKMDKINGNFRFKSQKLVIYPADKC